MELYQLKSFVAVAEEGNLTRAAERLFSSQPAVSAHIKALEEELGLSLFDRTARGMTLTVDGEKLLERADATLSSAAAINQLARQLQANPSGTLKIGVPLDGDILPLQQIAKSLIDSHPCLQLEFVHSTSGSIVKGLLNGDLDVGFAEGVIDSPLLQSQVVGKSVVVVAATPAYSETFATAEWSDLQQLPWVFKTPDCSYHQLMDRISKAHGLKLNKQYVIDHEATCLQFIRSGTAITVVNERVVKSDLDRRSLIIWDRFREILDINLVCLSKRSHERSVSAFLQAASHALKRS